MFDGTPEVGRVHHRHHGSIGSIVPLHYRCPPIGVRVPTVRHPVPPMQVDHHSRLIQVEHVLSRLHVGEAPVDSKIGAYHIMCVHTRVPVGERTKIGVVSSGYSNI